MNDKRVKWTKELIVSEIKRMHEENIPLNASYIMSNNSKLYGAARKHFTTWKQAIEASDLDYNDINLRSKENQWDKNKIKDEIKKLAMQGEPLNSDYVQKNHTKLHSAAQRYFDSWGDAVDYSGFDYEDIKGIKWTEETIIKEILNLSEQDLDLSSFSMQKHNMALFQAGCRIFGSWKQAVLSSGLDYNEFRKQKEWNPENVLSEIKSFINETNCASAGLVSKEYGALYQAARRNFKGVPWSDIVSLAMDDDE